MSIKLIYAVILILLTEERKENGYYLKRMLMLSIVVMLLASVLSEITVASPSWIDVWSWDPTYTYPTIVATPHSVLFGTTFGCNFEHGYPNFDVLRQFFLDSILYLSPVSTPKVGVYGAYNGSDYNSMMNTMNDFVSGGQIDSYTLTDVGPSNPFDANLVSLQQYDVIVLDAAPDPAAETFEVTSGGKTALHEYLQYGGKIVASAYIFVHWYDYLNWQRQLYNLDLSDLFRGAKPDISTYSDRAVTSAPFSTGVTLETYNVYHVSYPDNPWFHYFWKIKVPPPPVGGVWVPIDKFELLAPWITLASFLIVPTIAVSIVYVKHRKKQQT